MGPDQFYIRWTRPAHRDLQIIIDEIAEAAPFRAQQFAKRLQEAVSSLTWSPARCSRTREDSACRHLIVRKYRIIFEIDESEKIVWIMRILFPYQIFKSRH